MDYRALQELLQKVALNMNLQVEEVVREEDPMVDIVAPEGPCRVALPIIKAIQSNAKTVCLANACLRSPQQPKGLRVNTLFPLRDTSIFSPTLPHAFLWWRR